MNMNGNSNCLIYYNYAVIKLLSDIELMMIMVTMMMIMTMIVKLKQTFLLPDNPSSMADLEANLSRTMNHLAQNAKDLEVVNQ